MKITIRCKTLKTATLDQLKPLQSDLKFISDKSLEKFKKNLQQYGFSAPFLVWKNYILDGHQRKTALLALAKDGVEIPVNYPIVEVEAKSKREAKEKVLAFTSQYGNFNYETDFFDDMEGLTPDAFDLTADFGKFDFFKEEPKPGTTTVEFEAGKNVCPECGHEF